MSLGLRGRLEAILRRADGVAIALIGEDGLLVDAVRDDRSVDLEALGAELLSRMATLSRDPGELGEIEQLALAASRYDVVLSSVAKGYYLLLVLAGRQGLGRARFELRRARLVLEDEL